MPRYTAPLPRSARRQKSLARGLRVAAVSLALGASSGPARADATQDLYRAVHANDLGAVKASLVAGADPTVRDRDGLTPAMLADELGHRAIARYLQNTAPANEESTRSEAASERGFLDRLLARATARRQTGPVKVSIPIAAAPDKTREQITPPDKARKQSAAPENASIPDPTPAEMHDSAPPPSTGTADATEAAVAENTSPNESRAETQTKTDSATHSPPRAAAPRRERQVAKAAPRFAFPPPPRKPAFAAPEAVATDAPNNPFDPATAPLGSALAVIGNAPVSEPTFTPSPPEANPPSMEIRGNIAAAANMETDPGESAPATVSSPVVPATAATPHGFDHKTPNAFDRFLSSLFNLGGGQETTPAPIAPKTAHVGQPPEKAQTEATAAQSKPQDASNAIDRFLRRLFSLGDDDDSASGSAPTAQAEAPPPTVVQIAAAAPAAVKDGPNAIDLFLRRFFTDAAEPRVDNESPGAAPTQIASATPASKPAAAPALEPAPTETVAADDVDPLSRALRSLFHGMAEKNVHARAPRAENPPASPPIEVADASSTVASDRPMAEPPPSPATILTAVPAAPLTFAAARPAIRRSPTPNARAMSGAPPEAAAPVIVAENVLRPMIANPSAPSVEPGNPAVELAARPEPATAVPPRPAPFKPLRRPPLSGVPLALGQTAMIGRPWPAANLPPHSCIIKKAWNAGFCVEPIDWPAATLPIFDINSPLYRGTMAVTRYEGGTARQYHSVFPAAMFGHVVRFFEGNLGPATEEDLKTVAMPGQPALRNPIRRWISVDPQTGRKTAIEVRGFDDLRNFIPDAEYGVARLYDEGAGPVFEFLGTAELLLMRIRQTSAAFPTLEPLKNDPTTR